MALAVALAASRKIIAIAEICFLIKTSSILQGLWLCFRLDRWQRIAANLGLEAAQALIDRNQFDDRAPGIDEILERLPYLRERIQDLVHRSQCDFSGHDGRPKQDVGKDD